MDHLPEWLNLKTMGAVVLIGAGLWLLFRTLGEFVKLIIALALIGAGVFIFWKFSRPRLETHERRSEYHSYVPNFLNFNNLG